MSNIEWTEQTWNPTTGCDRVSAGCDNCYALTLAKRLKAMGSKRYLRDGNPKTSGPGFGLTVHTDVINEPLRWRKPRRVFVNSMSDLFHGDVHDNQLADIFAVMATASWHTFQILTKRHGRLGLLGKTTWVDQVKSRAAGKGFTGTWQWPLPNVWLGVSAETQQWADVRVPALLNAPAAVRFVSAEPLLAPINLHRYAWTEPSGFADDWESGLDWVIVGGESGPGARPMPIDNIRTLVDDCDEAGVALFVKQLGTVWARQTSWSGETVWNRGDHKGGNPAYWPTDLRVRQYPGGA